MSVRGYEGRRTAGRALRVPCTRSRFRVLDAPLAERQAAPPAVRPHTGSAFPLHPPAATRPKSHLDASPDRVADALLLRFFEAARAWTRLNGSEDGLLVPRRRSVDLAREDGIAVERREEK